MIQERCLGFVELNSLTGKNVAEQMIEYLSRIGLDVTRTVGLGFDGAGNMAGR